MKLLLDTNIVIWTLADSKELKERTRKAMQNAEICYVSSISIAEIEIKKSIGKLKIEDGYVNSILDSGFVKLQYCFKSAELLGGLPFHHKDPFDRMLITQALANNLTFLTNDDVLKNYNVPLIQNI